MGHTHWGAVAGIIHDTGQDNHEPMDMNHKCMDEAQEVRGACTERCTPTLTPTDDTPSVPNVTFNPKLATQCAIKCCPTAAQLDFVAVALDWGNGGVMRPMRYHVRVHSNHLPFCAGWSISCFEVTLVVRVFL